MNIVIVEGPDLAGKSTVINYLAKALNDGITLKNNYTKPSSPESIYSKYDDLLLLSTYCAAKFNWSIIFDRFYQSEVIYSYLRYKDGFKHHLFESFEDKCVGFEIKYLYINTPRYELERRYLERGDDNIKLYQLRELKKRYDHYYCISKLDRKSINTMDDDWPSALKGWIL